jgi:putative DNA primase/helicase
MPADGPRAINRFLQSDPSHYLTHRSDVPYDRTATCPLFEAFLREVFNDDKAIIRYLQGVLGYCLTGRTNRQEFYIFYGERGRNGKGTIIRIMEYVLGSYASPIQVETVFENPFSDKSQNELFTMIGKRLAIANEAQSSYRLKASFIKAISGKDRQKAKGLYKDAMAMTIKFKLVLQCNERPFIDSSDKALSKLATKEQVLVLQTQVNSIETQLRGIKHDNLETRVTRLEEHVLGHQRR